MPSIPTVAHSMPKLRETQQPVLSRESEFRVPEGWVALGGALQAPDGGDGRVLSIRIGVDFGTAYTKVAIRVADRVYFVPWMGTRNSAVHYLLPGELSRLPNDSVWLGRSPSAAEVHSGLKLPFLIDQVVGQAKQAATAAFLALVLRYARGWLYQEIPSQLRGRRLVWQLNIGCPTNSWSSGSVRLAYEGIATRAWQLSQASSSITLSDAVSLVTSELPELPNIGLDVLNFMPEFIAQLAGYVRSPQRRTGLHFLIDVGAGTLDLATFNVFRNGIREEDCFPIFASDVLPRGTHFLMEARLRHVGREQGAWDDLQAIPDGIELSGRLGADLRMLDAADRAFLRGVRHDISRLLLYTRTRRYGKAPEWTEGLPVFLSGGGSSCDLYGRALELSCGDCKVAYKKMILPVPDDVTSGSLMGRDFHRLSVAYGLTFDAEAVGRILAPHEIDDAPAFDPLVDERRERPDRDELYPK